MREEVKLNQNALKVLEKRYLTKNEKGEVIETPTEMFERVARSVAAAEKNYNAETNIEEITEKFFNLMASLDFLPNSPTLMNAGKNLGQLSACFVLPIDDSMESIFDSVKHAALIHKSGGGTGFSFSRLRPKNDVVLSTGGIASGPVSFLKVFNAATEAVKQGGTRRGANMGILRVDHPDIMEFITCKKNNSDITNFNLSVGITEKFMQAVREGADYELLNPRTSEVVGKLNAKEVFDLIIEMAWTNGEPGIVFLDRINRDNPTPHLGEIESTNPCGEQPLLPYEACNLGSINLAKMVKQKNDNWEIDYEKLAQTVNLAVRFLDNVIDVNKYPLEMIEKICRENRKIGLGVMGFADMLIRLKVSYNSADGVELARKVMKFIAEESKKASCQLADERGVFPNYEGSIYHKQNMPIRNATVTTIAPTGTLSIIANCSSGVEPIFALCYYRNVMDNEKLVEVNPFFEQIAKEEGFYNSQLMEQIAEHGTLHNISSVDKQVRDIFVTAHDISPEWHVKMQSAFQQFTDNAVSKTVNFPNSATLDDIREVYILAYEEGCKGVTVYRDGSRDGQVLNAGKTETPKPVEHEIPELNPRPRPAVTTGSTEMAKIGCGKLYITVNSDEHGLVEVFTTTGKSGGCSSQSEATGRVISLALRAGIKPEEIVKQIKGIRCPACLKRDGVKVMSCPDAMSKAIMRQAKYEKDKENIIIQNNINVDVKVEKDKEKIDSKDYCPECGSKANFAEGCVVCLSCGYSKCG